jgi:hypothetical protein
MKKIVGWYFFCLGTWLSGTVFCQTGAEPPSSLKFIDQYEIPFNTTFRNTVVGGLSGIDFDANQNLYYMISDDRSDKNDARFYSARILCSEKGIDSVQLIDVTVLRQANGRPYPNSSTDPSRTPDPESIRYSKPNDALVWVSEGERKLDDDTVLVRPALHMIGIDGRYQSSFTLPRNLDMHAVDAGPRRNGVLEGLSFSADFASLYACLEEPLYQDGLRADVQETDSFVRIYKFDALSRKNTEQYAYKLEQVARAPIPESGFKVNGVSEILCIGPNKLLVIERSSSAGRLSFAIKVFLADVSQAENIIDCESLITTPPRNPVTKKLLINMDDLGIYIDNIEGVTMGPTLPNGHKTLLFVTDNNFKPEEKTQLFLFEVIP